ncbi:MAG TPA: transporter substrate-binding domain-containing protein, partial [Spirochaetota bacterium]|nr:transporter substrate-binding domain-containing protein [Spirochaetota bacterium]
EDGLPTGFNVDLMREVARVMGFQVEISLGPWSTVRKELEDGKVDILSGMYFSKERDRVVDFSNPHTVVSHDLFVRKGSSISSLKDVSGRKILVQKGDIMHDFLLGKKLSAEIVNVNDAHEVVAYLGSGKGDGALLSRIQGLYFAHKYNLLNIYPVGLNISPKNYCFAVKEGDRLLVERLNRGIRILKDSGKYAELYNKWFGDYSGETRFRNVIKYILIILGIISFLFLILLAWWWMLRKKVALKTVELRVELARREKAEEEVQSLSQFRERIIENANVWINVLDSEKNVILWNTAAEKISGYTRDEVLGHGDIWILLYPDEKYRDEIVTVAGEILDGTRSVENFETTIQSKDGTKKIISWNSGYFVGRDGKFAGSIAVGLDVTERREMEDVLKGALLEKETLLKEIHHRVKNNMQIISSMMSLQTGYIHDDKDRELFRECQNRILSMSLVHEKLYSSNNLAKIDISDFLNGLVGELYRAYGVSEEKIRVKVNASHVLLGIDRAIPCALIINELVSNALKYAFRVSAEGVVNVDFLVDSSGDYRVSVADDGDGLPGGYDYKNASSLGLRLVNALALQLDGIVDVETGPDRGTNFIIRFPEKNK